ncbi:MAG: signal recognition particle protein [bacterium]
MFTDLSARLDTIFKKLRGRGKLTEKDVDDALREVRVALLEADVHFQVVKDFVTTVRENAVGKEVLESLSPGQQVVGVVYKALVNLLGGEAKGLLLAPQPPTRILLAGLQGSGKTTFAWKLATYLKKKGKRPMLVAADLQRPAAVEQLRQLAESGGILFFGDSTVRDPREIVARALPEAEERLADAVILDTAGRLAVDDDLMNEIAGLKRAFAPHEVLLAVDGMSGQDAVNVAKAFHDRLSVTGLVLTKMDGDARGGAALAIRSVTGCPVKFLTTGEGADTLEIFHPERLASRILGMGDVLTLVEKAQEAFDEKSARSLEEKLRKDKFDLGDFRDQLREIKKMGPLENVVRMIPGMAGKIPAGAQIDEKNLRRVEAIVDSMTLKERRSPRLIDGSRRRRIAMGSGTTVQDVNRLLRDFEEMERMMKKFRNARGLRMPGRRR